MDKKNDTINNINIEKVLTNYLQDDSVRSVDVERLILDNKYTDIADEVMRKHWDSIPMQVSDKKANETWKQLKEQTGVGVKKAPLKVRQKEIFHWAVAAIVLLAIMTNIYQLHQLGAGKVIHSSDVVVNSVAELQIDSLPRELLEVEVDRQEIAQVAPILKTPVAEPVEAVRLVEVVERETQEENVVEQPLPQQAGLMEYMTKTGETIELRLADGTTVKLHENTRITANLNDSVRTISLQGKAHFAVVSSRDIPFQISTWNVLIEVLGTEFEVDAHENAEQSAVRVDKGEVRVTTPDNVKFTLRPNQVLVFDNESQSVSILRGVANDSSPKKKR